MARFLLLIVCAIPGCVKIPVTDIKLLAVLRRLDMLGWKDQRPGWDIKTLPGFFSALNMVVFDVDLNQALFCCG
jgi:hypothetical protein